MNTRQIVKNAAANYSHMAAQVAATLLLTPLMLNRLGAELYGVWALTYAVVGYFEMAELGVTSATVRYVAEYRAKQDWNALNKTISTTLIWYLSIAGLAVAGSLVLAATLPHFFVLAPENVAAFRVLLVNVGLMVAIGFACTLPVQCVIAAQRQDVLNVCHLAVVLTTTAASWAVLKFAPSVFLLALIQVLGATATLIYSVVLARRFLPQARFVPHWWREYARPLGEYAGYAVLITLGSRLIYYSDSVVVGACLTVAAVAEFHVVQKLVEMMRRLVNTGVSVLGTFAGEQVALENRAELARLWRGGTMWALLISLPIATGFALFGGLVLRLWVGGEYRQAALALAWFGVGHLFDLAQSAAWQILMNAGRHRVLGLLTLAEGIANLTLSLVLVRVYGIVGVAMGTTIPLLARTLLFYPLMMPRVTDLPLRDYVRLAVMPPFLASLPAIGLMTFAAHWLAIDSLAKLGGLAAACAVLSAISAFFICLNGEQRARLSRWSQRKN
jgi:O-antigen/teichoic acid export membrane protein